MEEGVGRSHRQHSHYRSVADHSTRNHGARPSEHGPPGPHSGYDSRDPLYRSAAEGKSPSDRRFRREPYGGSELERNEADSFDSRRYLNDNEGSGSFGSCGRRPRRSATYSWRPDNHDAKRRRLDEVSPVVIKADPFGDIIRNPVLTPQVSPVDARPPSDVPALHPDRAAAMARDDYEPSSRSPRYAGSSSSRRLDDHGANRQMQQTPQRGPSGDHRRAVDRYPERGSHSNGAANSNWAPASQSRNLEARGPSRSDHPRDTHQDRERAERHHDHSQNGNERRERQSSDQAVLTSNGTLERGRVVETDAVNTLASVSVPSAQGSQTRIAIQALDMQNQEMRSMGNNLVTSPRKVVHPQNAPSAPNGMHSGYADLDSDSDSSEDFDTSGLTVDRVLLLIERQNTKCAIYNDKVKRASRRINKLTRLLSRVAANQDAPVSRNGNGRAVAEDAVSNMQPPAVPAEPIPVSEAAAGPPGPSIIAKPAPPLRATWKIKSRDTIDSLYNFDVRNAGPLARKPRTLLMPPEGAENGLAHTVIASTLDGKLHMFDKRHKRHYQSIGHEEMRNYWPEDMAWVTPTTLAVAAADKSCSASSNRGDLASLVPHQIALIYDCSKRKSRMTYKVQHLTENMPHDKGASVIYPFSAVSGDKTRWLTGGLDKRLFLWSYDGVFRGGENGAYSPVSHMSVHTEHTAAIFAILYNPHSEILYTGGQDSRLVGWSFPGQKNVLPSEKREGRIRDLTAVPGQPNLMLIGFTENRKQLRLWDGRTNRFVLEVGDAPPGDAESSRADTTRYMHPSIHAGGYLVSMGHPRSGKIGIWDMRYTGVERAPTQQLEGHHTKRVIVAKFDEHKRQETLISISHDNTINFSDFKLSKGEECQDPGA